MGCSAGLSAYSPARACSRTQRASCWPIKCLSVRRPDGECAQRPMRLLAGPQSHWACPLRHSCLLCADCLARNYACMHSTFAGIAVQLCLNLRPGTAEHHDSEQTGRQGGDADRFQLLLPSEGLLEWCRRTLTVSSRQVGPYRLIRRMQSLAEPALPYNSIGIDQQMLVLVCLRPARSSCSGALPRDAIHRLCASSVVFGVMRPLDARPCRPVPPIKG